MIRFRRIASLGYVERKIEKEREREREREEGREGDRERDFWFGLVGLGFMLYRPFLLFNTKSIFTYISNIYDL